MATNKNRINAYVGDEEYNAFTDFCDQWQCSQSKGVELMIRHFLMGEGNVNGNVISNVTGVSTDELSELRERLGKLESNVNGNVNGVTSDEVNDAIAQSLAPISDKLSALSIRLKGIESEIGGRYTVPINVESTPVDAPEGITSPESLEEKQLLESFTPQNDTLPIEEKTDGVLSQIEGQHSEVIGENIGDVPILRGKVRKRGKPRLSKAEAKALKDKKILSADEMCGLLNISRQTLANRLNEIKEASDIPLDKRGLNFAFRLEDGTRYIYENDPTVPSGKGAGHPKRFRKI